MIKRFLIKEITANASCKHSSILFDNNLVFEDVVNYATKKLNKFWSSIFKIRDCYPRKCLLMFSSSYAKTAITYGLLACGATTKTTIQPIKIGQRTISRAIFHNEPVDLLQKIMRKHHLQTIYELFLSQLISKLFSQIIRNSLFNFLGTFCMPKEVNTGRREKSDIPHQNTRTKPKQRSLKISILKIYNCLHSANLILYEMKDFSRYQVKNYLNLLNHNYVGDNQDLFHPLF